MVEFYKCKHCGQIVTKVNDSGVDLMCCNDYMVKLTANTVDAAGEKHIPVVEQNGNLVTVKVGSVTHPMTKEHYIQWICMQTNKGIKLHHLTHEQEPVTTFSLEDDEKVIAVFEYCNLHSLWMKN